jgi:hypothetical protein
VELQAGEEPEEPEESVEPQAGEEPQEGDGHEGEDVFKTSLKRERVIGQMYLVR